MSNIFSRCQQDRLAVPPQRKHAQLPAFDHHCRVFSHTIEYKIPKICCLFCRNAKFCSGDRKFNHLELFQWQITLYMPVITKWLLSDQCEISLFKIFTLPRLSKYRKGWLEFHIKIHFQVPLCFLIHFPHSDYCPEIRVFVINT